MVLERFWAVVFFAGVIGLPLGFSHVVRDGEALLTLSGRQRIGDIGERASPVAVDVHDLELALDPEQDLEVELFSLILTEFLTAPSL